MRRDRFAEEEAYRVAREAGLKQGLADAEERIAAAAQKTEIELTERLNKEYAGEKATLQDAERVRLQQLDQLITQLDDESCKRLTALHEDAVALAFEALCRLIGERFPDRALLSERISHAIASLRGQPVLRVKLNSRDKHRLEADEPGRTLMERHAHVQWIAEDSISVGDFVIDGAQGSLDVRLTDQVERLKALWLEIVSGAAGCPQGNHI
jgi:flagellar assembly protein FliH